MSPVHICIFGTNAATTMERPAIGQPSTGEQAAAQDALNLLRQHGFTITYDLPLPVPTSPRDKVLAWLDAQDGHHTSYDVARGSGVDYWMTEALLEQCYQVGRVGFVSGAGWVAATRTAHHAALAAERLATTMSDAELLAFNRKQIGCAA
jgi:hypothetical protein